jgi:hypothetical protein
MGPLGDERENQKPWLVLHFTTGSGGVRRKHADPRG